MEKLVEKSFKHGRYREVIGQIGDIAAGYYCRRIFSFVRDPDPRKDKFIRDFQTFFKAYIPNWKEKVCKYRSRGSSIKKFINKYRLSILGVNAYIMSIRMAGLYSKVHKTIISNYKKTNKYINDHAVIDRYAFYRNNSGYRRPVKE